MAKVVDGYEVYHWPEFKAFAERLGIVWDLWTTGMTIRIAEGEVVTVTQEYIPDPALKVVDTSKAVDTTSMHNKEFRTAMPPTKPKESWRDKEPLI